MLVWDDDPSASYWIVALGPELFRLDVSHEINDDGVVSSNRPHCFPILRAKTLTSFRYDRPVVFEVHACNSLGCSLPATIEVEVPVVMERLDL